MIRPASMIQRLGLDRGGGSGAIAAAGLVVIGLISVIVAFAVRTDRDIQVAGAAIALLGVLLSLRWPLLPLFALAVLIPIEEVVVIGDLGTLSRYASLLFIVAYGLPRLGRITLRAMPVAGYAFVLWAAFSASWAISSATSWTEIPALLLLLVTSVVVAQAIVDRPSLIRPIMWAYSVSAGATAFLGRRDLRGCRGGEWSERPNWWPRRTESGVLRRDPAACCRVHV